MNTSTPSALMTSMIDSLDLDEFENVASGTLVLTHPVTGAPTTSTITLASREHQSRKQIDLARARKIRTAFNQTGKVPLTDPTEDADEETDYLVASTLGWNLTQGGAPLPFSPEAARKVYTDPKKMWLRTQALVALNKTELFINSSAKA